MEGMEGQEDIEYQDNKHEIVDDFGGENEFEEGNDPNN